MEASEPRPHPSLADDALAWQQRLARVPEAVMLANVQLRIGAGLRATLDAEDIWQETLLHAWRDRARFQSDCPLEFRRWLLAIAENRIRNAVDRTHAARRGGGRPPRRLRAPWSTRASASGPAVPEPAHFATPSRTASERERATAMLAALDELPSELRDVVRLRVFEGHSTEATADALAIGISATKHRLRRGLESYARALNRHLAAGSSSAPRNPRTDGRDPLLAEG